MVRDFPDSEHVNQTGAKIELAAVSGLVDRFGEYHIPTQSDIERQFLLYTPRILCVPENPLLTFLSLRARADVTAKVADVPKQKRAQPRALLSRRSRRSYKS